MVLPQSVISSILLILSMHGEQIVTENILIR